VVVELAEQRLARCLDVMDQVLGTRAFFAGDYSIADIANAALVNALRDRAPHVLGARERRHVEGWFARVASRPAWGRALG
jgi:glutathione S-transferase